MSFIILLLINAGILLGMTYILPTVTIKNYTTAILVALVIGLLNATIGWLIRFPMNVVTLGLLSFVIHLFVTAVMIKIADILFSDFQIKGFAPAVIIALVMAIVGSLINFF
ncbi:phage holin family protein [Pedobacter metabolipauper]|uniref:Putative membrane protein n=1 Tax=Pedobacter metabolipauper TaxID=425513 RepID=A0A4R6SQU2_9SPHI|nr:phage holin family protein [Pedobacter metabolipauper]TDQ06608.1 putative membrane protein [Pedobacter metabolipauper]